MIRSFPLVDFAELLPITRVKIIDDLTSRKATLQAIAKILALDIPDLNYRDIFFALEEREMQASTVLDELPIAIPHCRMAECTQPVATLLFSKNDGVLFGSSKVRLFFSMCVPADAIQSATAVLRSVVKLCMVDANVEALLDQSTEDSLHTKFHELIASVNVT